MESFRVFSPSKINLTLAITGVRPDGFHNLISLVAPLDWGDFLLTAPDSTASCDTLACDYPGVPTDASNLILKAAAALRATLPADNQPPFVRFTLEKKTPVGAGLGGGSGNAAAALRALNRLCPRPLADAVLEKIAASVGSDCPLFVRGEPVVMRGRGERLERLPDAARARISGTRVCLFKPDFGINTAWAYGRMKAAGGAHYVSENIAEALLADWFAHPENDLPLFNNMQGVAFEKYVALPTLLKHIRETFRIPCLMSGSGSACFALPALGTDVVALAACVRAAWGDAAWLGQCALR